MALTRNDTLSQLSAGWLRGRYFLRDLFGQILIFLAIAILTFGYVTYNWYQSIAPDQLSYLWLYWKGILWAKLFIIPGQVITFHDTQQTIQIKASEIIQNIQLEKFFDEYLGLLKLQLINAIPWGIGAWFLLAASLFWSGKKQKDNQLLEGVQQISLKKYTQYLKKHKIKNAFKLGNAFWTKNSEVQHLLVTGDTGTGKTQLINQLLIAIRKLGDMVIVYDPKGDMVRDFYHADKDIIYSPFDTRSPKWDVWQDLNTIQAIETFAEAIIKESPNKDEFWSKSARMVLVASLTKAKQQSMSFSLALDMIMNQNIDDISQWLDGTEVASDFSNPKTAATVLTELKSQARALRYLPEVKNSDIQPPFSINSWLTSRFDQSENMPNTSQPWLFLPVQKKYKASAKPIMSAQIELISNFILSQPTSRQRRIWLIIDELPSLGKLSALPDLLAEGRGYGVASVLAIQNFSQLLKIYGKDDAHNLAGLCSSIVSMRTSDPQTAEYLTKRFGKQLRKEVQTNQSLSKGKAGSFSQGQTENISERPAVSETELHTLPDLKAFFKANGVPNPVKIDISILKIKPLSPPHCSIEEDLITPVKEEKIHEKKKSRPVNTWDI